MQQPGPGLPVAGLQARDEALDEFRAATHPGNLPHGSPQARFDPVAYPVRPLIPSPMSLAAMTRHKTVMMTALWALNPVLQPGEQLFRPLAHGEVDGDRDAGAGVQANRPLVPSGMRPLLMPPKCGSGGPVEAKCEMAQLHNCLSKSRAAMALFFHTDRRSS
jgi:hypothetical protein